MIRLTTKNLLSLLFAGSAALHVAPAFAIHPVAPVCGGSSQTFSNETPVEIPDSGVVTSTIVVSGLNPYIWDLDAQTFIQHNLNSDLDVTITSPAGTVVTLTTDNGGSFDNVFDGTLWDNSANPAGQVPYVTNNGLVTDHAYTDFTAASPLTPEESFAAFRGEDPNGVWTITISDDSSDESTGSLNSWSLDLNTLPASPIESSTTFTSEVPVEIPTGPALVAGTLAVDGVANRICDLNLTTNLTHTFGADLDITLTSPSGTVVTLTTDNGGGNDNTFDGTIWDDQANPAGQVPYSLNAGLATDNAYVNLIPAPSLVPEEGLTAFDGEDANGIWTVTISDDLAGDGGVLSSWSLAITTCTETDSDGDTVGDTCDSCPVDPAKQSPGACGCGVPDLDENHNEITDCLEPTPTPTPTPTMTPTVVAEPSISPTATPTSIPTSAASTGLKYVETASSFGVGGMKAPKIQVLSEGADKVSLKSCFKFNQLVPVTANVYGIVKDAAGNVVLRKRIRQPKCLEIDIKTVGSYELYFHQTRYNAKSVNTKEVKFDIVNG